MGKTIMVLLRRILAFLLTFCLVTQPVFAVLPPSAHISDVAGIGADHPKTAPLADRVVQDIQRGLIRATVNAGVSTAIQGGKLDENLISALRMEAASVIGEHVAQEIGSAAKDGDLNTAGQLIAHAALGCVVGAAASGDCGSGAAGGMVGETVGLITKARLANWLEKRVEDARSGGVSTAQLLQELNEYQDAGVDVARLVSGFAVAVAGGDVDTAALTGGNAAENNALCGGICIGVIAVIVAGYTTYSGDGDPLAGLAVIGSGDDPLSQAVAAGTSAAVEWSATEYPDQTAAVLGVLEATGNAIDATVTYVDDTTGNEVSRRWNEIPEHTRNQIKGGAKIAAKEPNRIYSARELKCRAENPRTNNAANPNHNFPESFNEDIFKGNKTIVSDKYHLYTKPGTLNGRSGTYEIGVKPSASGRTEVITHRFFNPSKK